MSHSLNRLQGSDALDMLLELIGQISSELDINKVLRNIINATTVLTNSEACSVFLIDDVTDELILSIPTGPTSDSISGKAFPRVEGIAGWVAEKAIPQIVNDVKTDNRFRGDFNPELFTTRNMICAPLLNQSKKVIGVLQAINKADNGEYLEEELPLFQALASHAAIAITNARLHKERTTLLSEIHHRVKNNMAVVSSLIQMQAMREPDEEVQGKLFNNVARISSMAIVHEQLYQSDSFSRLDFTKNIEKIVTNTIHSLQPKTEIKTSFDCDKIDLNINQSIPCSLIVNEVIIRLVKNSFWNMEKAELKLILKEEKNQEYITLALIDNGRSVADYIETADEEDSDLQLIDLLAKQLNAAYRYIRSRNDNRFELNFQKSEVAGAGNHAL